MLILGTVISIAFYQKRKKDRLRAMANEPSEKRSETSLGSEDLTEGEDMERFRVVAGEQNTVPLVQDILDDMSVPDRVPSIVVNNESIPSNLVDNNNVKQ